MGDVRRSRLRTGAETWGLFRDTETPHQFMEYFIVSSWEEHMRQHNNRQTGYDREREEEANSLSHPAPRTVHQIAVNPAH